MIRVKITCVVDAEDWGADPEAPSGLTAAAQEELLERLYWAENVDFEVTSE